MHRRLKKSLLPGKAGELLFNQRRVSFSESKTVRIIENDGEESGLAVNGGNDISIMNCTQAYIENNVTPRSSLKRRRSSTCTSPRLTGSKIVLFDTIDIDDLSDEMETNVNETDNKANDSIAIIKKDISILNLTIAVDKYEEEGEDLLSTIKESVEGNILFDDAVSVTFNPNNVTQKSSFVSTHIIERLEDSSSEQMEFSLNNDKSELDNVSVGTIEYKYDGNKSGFSHMNHGSDNDDEDTNNSLTIEEGRNTSIYNDSLVRSYVINNDESCSIESAYEHADMNTFTLQHDSQHISFDHTKTDGSALLDVTLTASQIDDNSAYSSETSYEHSTNYDANKSVYISTSMISDQEDEDMNSDIVRQGNSQVSTDSTSAALPLESQHITFSPTKTEASVLLDFSLDFKSEYESDELDDNVTNYDANKSMYIATSMGSDQEDEDNFNKVTSEERRQSSTESFINDKEDIDLDSFTLQYGSQQLLSSPKKADGSVLLNFSLDLKSDCSSEELDENYVEYDANKSIFIATSGGSEEEDEDKTNDFVSEERPQSSTKKFDNKGNDALSIVDVNLDMLESRHDPQNISFSQADEKDVEYDQNSTTGDINLSSYSQNIISNSKDISNEELSHSTNDHSLLEHFTLTQFGLDNDEAGCTTTPDDSSDNNNITMMEDQLDESDQLDNNMAEEEKLHSSNHITLDLSFNHDISLMLPHDQSTVYFEMSFDDDANNLSKLDNSNDVDEKEQPHTQQHRNVNLSSTNNDSWTLSNQKNESVEDFENYCNDNNEHKDFDDEVGNNEADESDQSLNEEERRRSPQDRICDLSYITHVSPTRRNQSFNYIEESACHDDDKKKKIDLNKNINSEEFEYDENNEVYHSERSAVEEDEDKIRSQSHGRIFDLSSISKYNPVGHRTMHQSDDDVEDSIYRNNDFGETVDLNRNINPEDFDDISEHNERTFDYITNDGAYSYLNINANFSNNDSFTIQENALYVDGEPRKNPSPTLNNDSLKRKSVSIQNDFESGFKLSKIFRQNKSRFPNNFDLNELSIANENSEFLTTPLRKNRPTRYQDVPSVSRRNTTLITPQRNTTLFTPQRNTTLFTPQRNTTLFTPQLNNPFSVNRQHNRGHLLASQNTQLSSNQLSMSNIRGFNTDCGIFDEENLFKIDTTNFEALTPILSADTNITINEPSASLFVKNIANPRLSLMGLFSDLSQTAMSSAIVRINRLQSKFDTIKWKCPKCRAQRPCVHQTMLESTKQLSVKSFGDSWNKMVKAFRLDDKATCDGGMTKINMKMQLYKQSILGLNKCITLTKKKPLAIKASNPSKEKCLLAVTKIEKLNSLMAQIKKHSDGYLPQNRRKLFYKYMINRQINPIIESWHGEDRLDYLLMGSRVRVAVNVAESDGTKTVESATVYASKILFPLNKMIEKHYQILVQKYLLNKPLSFANKIFLQWQMPVLQLLGDVTMCKSLKMLNLQWNNEKPFILDAWIIKVEPLIRFRITIDLNPIGNYQYQPLNYKLEMAIDNIDVEELTAIIESCTHGSNKLYRLFHELLKDLQTIFIA